MDHNSKRQGGLVPFVATLWLALFAAWLFSGEQFLDLVFSMPDAGPIDDWILSAVLWAEGLRAEAGLPDLFAALRSTLHAWTGLG